MVIIVTGGSRGLGQAIVNKFLQQGHRVAFCSVQPHNVEHALKNFQATYPAEHIIGQVVDMCNPAQVEGFVHNVFREWGGIDVIVNNAGTYIPGNISEQSFSELQHQIDVNLYSAFHLTQAALPYLLKSPQAHIFNMCSIASLKAYPGGGAYSVSKYALLGFSDNLREELKEKGVKVTAVLPGAVYTDSWAGSGVSPERIMEAEDIALSIYHATQLSPQAVVERIVLRPQLGDL